MISRHLLDSLAILPYVRGSSQADLGTGPGLPGIVLAIAAPGREMLLVDSNGKKVRFLREAIRSLKLDGVRAEQSRVEAVEVGLGVARGNRLFNFERVAECLQRFPVGSVTWAALMRQQVEASWLGRRRRNRSEHNRGRQRERQADEPGRHADEAIPTCCAQLA